MEAGPHSYTAAKAHSTPDRWAGPSRDRVLAGGHKGGQVLRTHIPKSELDFLAQGLLFAGCSRHELREIARLRTPADSAEGTVLTKENAPGSEFFLLLEG